jgi:hypothetical protein
MQFTYSFPTGFTFLYLVQLDATTADNPYSPGSPDRVDTWLQWSRWKRVRYSRSLPRLREEILTERLKGLFGGSRLMLLFKWFNLLLCLAALATAGLGKSQTPRIIRLQRTTVLTYAD